MRSVSPTQSERLFEEYLKDTGHAGWDMPEPNLGVRRRPDYLIAKGGDKAIAEVKEFSVTRYATRKRAALDAAGTFDADAKEVLAGLRSKVRDGARQLSPLQDSGLPLVVVVGNPNGIDVDLSPEAIGWALYGDPTVTGWFDPIDGSAHSAHFVRGRNGRLSR